jgi:MYXO-CTERM domain-containing protein
VTHVSPQTFAALAAALIAFAPVALAAGETAPIGAIVASHAHPDEAQRALDVTLEELERDHPAVARAIGQPNHVTPVDASEDASTHAFFRRLDEANATAVRVGGEVYTVGITLAQGVPPGDDGSSLAPQDDGKEAPAPAALLALAALGAALLARRKASA